MALEVGAKAVNLKYFYGHLLSRKALTDDRFWPYPRLDSFVDEGMLVDGSGERFVDEGRGDVAVANELARTDDVTGAALIFDQATWDAARDDAFSNSVKTPAPNPWLLDNDGEIFQHQTIEGLARELGMEGAKLTRTMAQYNHALESGGGSALQTAHARPLAGAAYGLESRPVLLSMGGVLEWPSEALNRDDKPIRIVRCRRHHRRADGRLSGRLHRRVDASGCDRHFGW
jgi:fumarate reductase flavoprotein subunit